MRDLVVFLLLSRPMNARILFSTFLGGPAFSTGLPVPPAYQNRFLGVEPGRGSEKIIFHFFTQPFLGFL